MGLPCRGTAEANLVDDPSWRDFAGAAIQVGTSVSVDLDRQRLPVTGVQHGFDSIGASRDLGENGWGNPGRGGDALR